MLRQFAQETGGRAFFPSRVEDLKDVYGQIADELSSQYTLGYASKNGRRDGGWRRVVVQVARPNATARTKRGYYARREQLSSSTAAHCGAADGVSSRPTLTTRLVLRASLPRLLLSRWRVHGTSPREPAAGRAATPCSSPASWPTRSSSGCRRWRPGMCRLRERRRRSRRSCGCWRSPISTPRSRPTSAGSAFSSCPSSSRCRCSRRCSGRASSRDRRCSTASAVLGPRLGAARGVRELWPRRGHRHHLRAAVQGDQGEASRFFFTRLPSLQVLDVMNSRAVFIGWLLMTVGLLSGALWIGQAQAIAPDGSARAGDVAGGPEDLRRPHLLGGVHVRARGAACDWMAGQALRISVGGRLRDRAAELRAGQLLPDRQSQLGCLRGSDRGSRFQFQVSVPNGRTDRASPAGRRQSPDGARRTARAAGFLQPRHRPRGRGARASADATRSGRGLDLQPRRAVRRLRGAAPDRARTCSGSSEFHDSRAI